MTPEGVLIYFPLKWLHTSLRTPSFQSQPLCWSHWYLGRFEWRQPGQRPSASPSVFAYPLIVEGLIFINLWGPAPVALSSVPVHHWLSELLQLSMLLKDCQSPQSHSLEQGNSITRRRGCKGGRKKKKSFQETEEEL